jgi:TPR repeat protein
MFKAMIFTSLFIIQLSTATAVAESKIDAGQSHALFSQAMAHLLGIKGQEKSSKMAFKIFETLAQQGWKTAQHMLGNMYFKGQGTDQNKVKAYLWYSLAAKQDFNIAQEKVIYLRQHLAQNKIKEAEILVAEWKN